MRWPTQTDHVCDGVYFLLNLMPEPLTFMPQAARAGARTRLTLSPTPPVLCLSTTRPSQAAGHDKHFPEFIMAEVKSMVSLSDSPRIQTAISHAPAAQDSRFIGLLFKKFPIFTVIQRTSYSVIILLFTSVTEIMGPLRALFGMRSGALAGHQSGNLVGFGSGTVKIPRR